MAASKPAPEPEAPPASSAPESQPESTPEPAPVVGDAATAAPSDPPQPIHTYKAQRGEPYRAGGHVLTERGWEIDTAPPEQEK